MQTTLALMTSLCMKAGVDGGGQFNRVVNAVELKSLLRHG